MPSSYRILIVDDDINQLELVRDFLQMNPGLNVDMAWNETMVWEKIDNSAYDVILLDYQMPDTNGLKIMGEMHEKGYRVPVIMVTGQGDERIAAQAIKQGAVEYIVKGGNYLEDLPIAIEKTIRVHELQQSVEKSLEQILYQALLLNNVRDAVVVWNEKGKITFWNPAAEELYYKNSTACIEAPVEECYLSLFDPPVSLSPADIGQEHERIYQTKTKGMIWVSSRLSILRDPRDAHHIIGYMDVSRDITGRKKAEALLRESEARYRAIVEDHQTEMIRRFLPNGRLTFVNEAYCRYFNQKREDLLGQDFLINVPAEEQPCIKETISRLTSESPVQVSENRVTLNGEVRWNEWTDRAIFDDSNRFIEFQSVGRDITERKRMQEQIQIAQTHLIQSARLTAIGELSSGIAHQIYNPLTTIIADAQLLVMDLPADHPARESAVAIEKAGWRAQQVVEKLLEFSRPMTNTLEKLSVNKTIEQALSLVCGQIEANGILLDTKLDDNVPLILANAHQLEDLWVNLLLLARDATADGSSHTIKIESKKNSAGSVVIEIKDDGKPIPTEQLASIFEPNFTGPNCGRGSGMELSICREIVRQHQGKITAESTAGSGTVFRVTLPEEK